MVVISTSVGGRLHPKVSDGVEARWAKEGKTSTDMEVNCGKRFDGGRPDSLALREWPRTVDD